MNQVEHVFFKIKQIIVELSEGKTSKSIAISELCYLLTVVNLNGARGDLTSTHRNALFLSILNQIQKIQDAATVLSKTASNRSISKFINKGDPVTVINNLNFSSMSLPHVRFKDMHLIACNFDNSDLRNSLIVNCELQGCTFNDADLSHSKILRSKLLGCSMDGANVTGVKGL